ncbi:helix-turn-helix transcriptional regulator [Streptomyces sp. NPDC017529]|uniref:helix-turn-helix transcriptional regulator n=1 Tax=Streptomyces sp. NPDC017529 TaxID=3365000 RepID=UPI003790C254
MRRVYGKPNRDANARRKPLGPLPAELGGPAREFVTALRRMHGELGLSLKELEGRLPASRSSLSRYLRGQSLPDERLLVQWCKVSFTGEDRLPALVDLLHRAQEAEPSASEPSVSVEEEGPAGDGAGAGSGDSVPESGGRGLAWLRSGSAVRRRLRYGLAALGVAVAVSGATAAVWSMNAADDTPPASGASASGTAGGEPATASPSPGAARITVHNVERACRQGRGANCALGLARDPYLPYRPSNIAGRVWHGDVLRAECRISNGVTVTDEVGGHSSVWFRVVHGGRRMWVPGIRIRPEQVDNTTLPACPV